jgi:hypothetical protein
MPKKIYAQEEICPIRDMPNVLDCNMLLRYVASHETASIKPETGLFNSGNGCVLYRKKRSVTFKETSCCRPVNRVFHRQKWLVRRRQLPECFQVENGMFHSECGVLHAENCVYRTEKKGVLHAENGVFRSGTWCVARRKLCVSCRKKKVSYTPKTACFVP